MQNEHEQFAGDDDAGDQAEDGDAVPITDGGPTMAAFDADVIIFTKDLAAVHAGVWGIGFGGGDRFGSEFFSSRRGGGKEIGLSAAATGGHHAATTAAAFHGGR